MYCVNLQIMGIFILLMEKAEFWHMQTPLDSKKEGTHTLMMMKPGPLAKEVSTVGSHITIYKYISCMSTVKSWLYKPKLTMFLKPNILHFSHGPVFLKMIHKVGTIC